MAIRVGENLRVKSKEEAAVLLVKHIKELKSLSDGFKQEYGLDIAEILSSKEAGKEESVPLCAFRTRKLSSLEIIVKYLKEDKEKSYHEIAVLLNRDNRTIWCTYNNSLKKSRARLAIKKLSPLVPLEIFKHRKLSVLESLSIYLKDNLGYSFNMISGLLMKDYQTVYTTYRRGKLKNG